MNTAHFNIFNTGEESFFTPGAQLANIAKVKPDAPAIVYINPDNKESVMSWHTLEVLSNRIAWYLLDQGITKGKSVIVALPNIPTHIALAFGIWKAGGCYVPISNRVPKRNLLEICECVSPSLVVTNRWKPEEYKSISSSELKELSKEYPEHMPPDVLAIPNLANCSGGSSGKTKVIQQNMAAGESDEGLQSWFSISGMRFEMRQLLAGPLFHGAPHSAAFNGLYSGNTLYMPSCFDAKAMVALIKKYQIQYVQMVPTLMQRILQLPGFKKEDLASLEVFCHTGGACSADLKRKWFDILPPEKIYEIYSMTECVGMTAIRGDEWLTHIGSVGRMPFGEIAIRDEDGKDLPVGETGEIFMSWGTNMPKVEYKNVTPLACDERGFRSVGDIGYVDEEGYLYFKDRRSDMIVTGGENVFAAEIENVLKKHKKVADAIVVGLPDKEWGRRIHAFVETTESVDDKTLIKFALNYLPPYKIPKSFEYIDCIPRNESGKVIRSQMVDDYLEKIGHTSDS